MGRGIRAEGLTKHFGDTVAVEDVTFEVTPGEVFGFLGPNGAGKTTTVRMLTTSLSLTAGRAEVAGVPVSYETGLELRRRIGVMPENAGLYLKLSVHDNLEFFAGLYGLAGAEAESRIGEALAAVGLSGRAGDRAGTLSKGLKQRAALARTLLSQPEVLFLDEPTAGLDPQAAVEVRGLVESLRASGVTVFLTTHRLDEAERLCDRVAIINRRLLTVATTADLRRGLFGSGLEVRVLRPLADPAAVFAGIEGVEGWEGDEGRYFVRTEEPTVAAPAVTRALVAAGADVVHLAEAAHSLEDAYLKLVAEAGT